MNIGIMGGTFNPIHMGHLILSEYIMDELGLDKIIFIPTGHPPHKVNKRVLDGFHRKTMTELSIEDNPRFALSDIELKKSGLSYTVDTIRDLKNIYKADKLFMIIGADSLFNIESWQRAKELFQGVTFLVADRVLREKKDLKEDINRLNKKYNTDIQLLHTPLIEISSTEIRERVRKNKSIKYLVKENVYRYIIENNLYV